jgi:hypothetical protein
MTGWDFILLGLLVACAPLVWLIHRAHRITAKQREHREWVARHGHRSFRR